LTLVSLCPNLLRIIWKSMKHCILPSSSGTIGKTDLAQTLLNIDFAQCNSINKSNYHLINPCSFEVGELVPKFGVHHWKEREMLHNIGEFRNKWVGRFCANACRILMFAHCNSVVWHLIYTKKGISTLLILAISTFGSMCPNLLYIKLEKLNNIVEFGNNLEEIFCANACGI
jgi:hypothetical protein